MNRLSLVIVISVGLIMFAVGGIYGSGYYPKTPTVSCTIVIGKISAPQTTPSSYPYPGRPEFVDSIPLLKCGDQLLLYDLSRLNLSRLNLSKMDLSKMDYSDVDLSKWIFRK